MHSILIISSSIEERKNYIKARLHALGISSFETVVPSVEDSTSIGIGDIRIFIHQLSLLPQQGLYIAGIIEEAEKLTIEAQQALLKTLEEPPSLVYIFLGAANTHQLIPTIISRCQITLLSGNTTLLMPKEADTTMSRIQDMLLLAPGERLAHMQSVGKTKEDMFSFIDQAIQSIRQHLILSTSSLPLQNKDTQRMTTLLHSLLDIKKYQMNNVSLPLLIEHALLTLP